MKHRLAVVEGMAHYIGQGGLGDRLEKDSIDPWMDEWMDALVYSIDKRLWTHIVTIYPSNPHKFRTSIG
jgi:hypothetical protein